MRRVRMLVLGLALVAGLIGVPHSAFAAQKVTFGSSPRAFSPNGDGMEDRLETTVTFAEPGVFAVYVLANFRGMSQVAEVLPSGRREAGTYELSWDGRDEAGESLPEGGYTFYARSGDPNTGTVATLATAIEFRGPGTFVSPQAGARLAGSVDLVWSGGISGVFIRLADCGSWYLFQSEGSFTSARDASLAGCPSGRQELRATARWSDRFSAQHEAVVTIEVEVLGDGPQIVLMPGVTGGARKQTMVRSTDTALGTVTWPVRCTNVDPTSFALVVRNSDGEAVRRFGRAPGDPSCGGGHVDWDGRDEDGKLVPDGTYIATATVSDDAGRSATDEVEVEVDGEAPAMLTSPRAGDQLSTSMDLAWRSRPDVSITSITAELPGCDRWQAKPTGDGDYGLRDVDITDCSPGAQALSWTVEWRDARKKERTYRVSTPVRLADVSAPEIQPPGAPQPRVLVLAPTGPDRPGSVFWSSSCRDGSDLVTYAVVIRDHSDRTVRTLPTTDPRRCQGWRTTTFDALWDGLDDHGERVADGSYQAVQTFTDSTGLSSSQSLEIVVDSRPPVQPDGLSDGGALPLGAPVSWTPRDGVSVTRLEVGLTGHCDVWRTLTAQADGRFVSPDLGAQACSDGQLQLRSSVVWTDAYGVVHYWSDSIRVTRPDTTAPEVSLRADKELIVTRADDDHLAGVEWTLECADGSDVSFGTTILDARQRPVRQWPAGSADLAACRDGNYYTTLSRAWDGTDARGKAVPDGTYTIRFDVTDAGGLATAVTRRVFVDGRAPGQLLAPSPGTAVIAGDQPYVLRPRADLPGSVYRLVLRPEDDGEWSQSTRADADGNFRARVHPRTPNGRSSLIWMAEWKDRNGDTHTYRSRPRTILVHRPSDLSVEAWARWGDELHQVQIGIGFHVASSVERRGTVDFGDGTTQAITSSGSLAPVWLYHDYPRTGTYVITVQANAAGTLDGPRSVAVTSVAVDGAASADNPSRRVQPQVSVPTVIGFARPGTTLRVDPGVWGSGDVALSYQWYRDGHEIDGADRATFVVSRADRRHRLQVRVSGEIAGFGTVERFSAATSVVPRTALPTRRVPVRAVGLIRAR